METFRYTGQINNKTGLPENHGIGNTYIFGIFWAGRYTGYWHNGYVNGFGVLEASTQGYIHCLITLKLNISVMYCIMYLIYFSHQKALLLELTLLAFGTMVQFLVMIAKQQP